MSILEQFWRSEKSKNLHQSCFAEGSETNHDRTWQHDFIIIFALNPSSTGLCANVLETDRIRNTVMEDGKVHLNYILDQNIASSTHPAEILQIAKVTLRFDASVKMVRKCNTCDWLRASCFLKTFAKWWPLCASTRKIKMSLNIVWCD